MKEDGYQELLRLTVSIVSHGQADLVYSLLVDLKKICTEADEVIVTLNIDEVFEFDERSFPCSLTVVKNKKPLGFGSNHNQAFSLSKSRYFCVLNPDIRIFEDPFTELLSRLVPGVGVVAPQIVNSDGEKEKNARKFPTPLTIIQKALGGEERHLNLNNETPDWVAGMFMLFPAQVFREVNGFDERYFLYYEDVDVCVRLTLSGYAVAWCFDIAVQHDGQWESHSDSVYRRCHLASMLRYFFSPSFLKIFWKRFFWG